MYIFEVISPYTITERKYSSNLSSDNGNLCRI